MITKEKYLKKTHYKGEALPISLDGGGGALPMILRWAGGGGGTSNKFGWGGGQFR